MMLFIMLVKRILFYFIRYNFEELIPMIYKFEIPMKIRIRLYEVNDMKHPFDGISFYFDFIIILIYVN